MRDYLNNNSIDNIQKIGFKSQRLKNIDYNKNYNIDLR